MGRIRGFDVLTCAVCGADCGESLKKVSDSVTACFHFCMEFLLILTMLRSWYCMQPKVQNHTYGCSASAFNCIDCGRTFDRYSVKVWLLDPCATVTCYIADCLQSRKMCPRMLTCPA